jgi:hypothetical protein
LFELFAGVVEDVVGHDPAVQSGAPRAVGDAGLFFEQDRFVSECSAAATVFGGDRYAQQPEFSGSVPERTVDLVLFGESLPVRCEFGGEELRGELAQVIEFGVEPRRRG